MVKQTQIYHPQDQVLGPVVVREEIEQQPFNPIDEAIDQVIQRTGLAGDVVERIIPPLLELKNISEKPDSNYIQILTGITRIPEDEIRPIVEAYDQWIDEIDIENGVQSNIDQIRDQLDESYHPFIERVLKKWWSIEVLIENGSENVDVNQILSQVLNDISDDKIERIMDSYFDLILVQVDQGEIVAI